MNKQAKKPFFRRHIVRQVWFLLDLFLITAYYICRLNRTWMNLWTERVTGPFQQMLGRLCYRTSLSVMECLAAGLVLFVLLYLVWCLITFLADRGHRLERLYVNFLTALCLAGAAAAGCFFMWGANFWADGFQEKAGLYGIPVSVEDLQTVTTYFAQKASETAESVARDGNGRFIVPRAEILENAPEVYDGVEKLYPFLTIDDLGVKGMTFSRVMSLMDFTGFYCSFTGEANVNTDSPACLLPSTCAHEMAHQRGIASEQECNFIAVLACVNSGNPAYIYSGWLMGYIYLGNALYRAEPDAYWEIRDTLAPAVLTDMEENNTYWEQFRGTPVQKASNTVYDGILKSYGEERGMQSYGAMVDLLAAYYRKNGGFGKDGG